MKRTLAMIGALMVTLGLAACGPTAEMEPQPSPTIPASPTRVVEEPEVEPEVDPRFETCGEAIEAGYGPYMEDEDEEYTWYRDGDKDGDVCESN